MKRILSLFSLIAALILVVGLPVSMWYVFGVGEDIYIAQSVGIGDTGLACPSAHAYTWFNDSGNWGVGAGKISPGDTVHVCGTITGSGVNTTALTFQGSGSAGMVITVHLESGAHFTNAAWADPGAILIPPNTEYVAVEGSGDLACGWVGLVEVDCPEYFENTDNGSALGHQQASSAIFGRPINHVTIKNLGCRNLYVQEDGGSTSDHGVDFGDCFHIGGDHDLLANLSIYQTYQGATIDGYVGAGSGEMRNIYAHHVNWGFTAAGHEADAHVAGLKLHDSEVRDWHNWDDVDPNNCCHHNGVIFQEQAYDNTGIDNLEVYNMRFTGDSGVHMTAPVFLDCENSGSYCYPNAKVYNSVFVITANGPTNGFVAVGAGGSGWYVYEINNDFIYPTNLTASCVRSSGDGLSGGGIVVLINNAFKNCGTALNFHSANGPNLNYSDYNNYDGISPDLANFNDFMATYHNLMDWQAASVAYYGGIGMDSHSAENTSNLDGTTWKPSPGSDLIETGVDASGVCPECAIDPAGVSRPTHWSIGAYEPDGGGGGGGSHRRRVPIIISSF